MLNIALLLLATPAHAQSSAPLPTVNEMIAARSDLWGDAAVKQLNGASYSFFKDLLPPLRWVNTDFRHYPIMLSAPRAAQKTRLVSNGSAINPRANQAPMWYEQGTPVTFFVGDPAEPFGADLKRLEGPAYLDGSLPVVSLKYRTSNAIYKEEVFAPVHPHLAASGTSFVQFSLAGDASTSGIVETRIDSKALLADTGGALFDTEKCCIVFSRAWKWNADRKALTARLTPDETAELAIYTKPANEAFRIDSRQYEKARRGCVEGWNQFLAGGTAIATPEPIVNDACRSTLIGIYILAVGDRLNYSAGNAYAKLYEGECGDVLRSIMQFGHLEDAPAMLKPLLEFDRKATRFHVAGHKLQLLAYFYWMTRDAKTVRDYEPFWRPSVDLILDSRESESGLLPKDRYAGDIDEQVYSLNSNANCWRGLRDVAAMLDDMGYLDDAEKLRNVAFSYREAILAAVAKSERLDTKPPFIPVGLLADEPAHDPLTATRKGSYYDLMCPYIIGSEIFGQNSDRETWLIEYMQQHGGIAMGMVRSMPHQGQFKDQPGVNPLYGLRYQLALLRRDDRERALVGFYGQLAQGMTRDTFIGGEGSRFLHGDADGRSFYLPPNSASNAAWLTTLRNLPVQDWDLDEDARPDTLRLLYAAPRGWLADKKGIRVANAPTMFGPITLEVSSHLGDGHVTVNMTPPPRATKQTLLRAPLPDGWQVESVQIDGNRAPTLDQNTVDLTGRTKQLTVKFNVRRE